MVASQENSAFANSHPLLGHTQESHVQYKQCPCHSQNSCMMEMLEKQPLMPFESPLDALDLSQLPQHSTVPAACARLSWAVNSLAREFVCKEYFCHSLESWIMPTVSVQHVELEKSNHLNKMMPSPGQGWGSGLTTAAQARMSGPTPTPIST